MRTGFGLDVLPKARTIEGYRASLDLPAKKKGRKPKS